MFDNLMWALYWIDVLSNLGKYLLTALMLTLGLGLIVGFAMSIAAEEFENPFRTWKRMIITTTICTLTAAVVLSFIPSKQTMYLMLGAKLTDGVVNSEVGQKVQKVLNGKLDEYLSTFEWKKGEKK